MINGKVASPNGKVPAWLAELGIKEGEYFSGSKLRAKRAMRSKCFSPAARIHICLGLHTEGFQQELAVKMEGGKKVPLQPVDVCNETGISRNHFREAMVCLEAQGLARQKGLTKGRFELYSYMVPRPVDESIIVPRAGTIIPWASPELSSLLTRFRIRFPDNFVPRAGTIQELERLARVTKEAEMSLRAFAKVTARGDAYKDERNEINIERNGSSSSSAVSGTTLLKAEDEEETVLIPEVLPATIPAPVPPPTDYETLKALYPKERFDDPKTKKAWAGMTRDQRQTCIERLRLYLKCPRWNDQAGRWIPLSSTWIATYEADPPPLIRKHGGLEAQAESINETVAVYREMKKWMP